MTQQPFSNGEGEEFTTETEDAVKRQAGTSDRLPLIQLPHSPSWLRISSSFHTSPPSLLDTHKQSPIPHLCKY